MSLKLYYVPFTRATRPRWLLEELGVPYELVRLDVRGGQNRTPEYRAIHPHGAVPALVDGTVTMFESAAICLYLADRFSEKRLAPPVGDPARGSYYQWMVYSAVTLEPPLDLVHRQNRQAAESRDRTAMAAASARLNDELAPVVAAALGDHPYILGGDFSAADVMVASELLWAARLDMLANEKLKEYAGRMMQRPAFQRMLATP